MNKLELLSPAGDIEKLKTAILYGADAVYIGGASFGLRTASKNFDFDELCEGVKYAHSKNAKVYAATNIVAKNRDIKEFKDYLQQLIKAEIDAVIVTDLGLFSLVREHAPDMEIHISTQANVTNYESCNFFYKLGAKRIVLARELPLDSIAEIREKTNKNLQLEAFAHGAMCISYSGRCLLSNYFTSRDANAGNCAQSCRWEYALMEQTREGEYFPVYEDEGGTFILNSKDLCMVNHIKEMAQAGITSFKIEGRVKSDYYVAGITDAYRGAIDEYTANPDSTPSPLWYEKVCKVSHRRYYTGFYMGEPGGQCYESSIYIRDMEVCAVVTGYDHQKGMAQCVIKNKIVLGDKLEILSPNQQEQKFVLTKMFSQDNQEIESAPNPMATVYIPLPKIVEGSYIRRNKIS